MSHALARSAFVRVETSVSLVMALFEIEAAMTVSRTSTRTCCVKDNDSVRGGLMQAALAMAWQG